MKTSIPPVLITLALVCFAVVQDTQAVSPSPDGGYPGFTTAEGQNALKNLTTGQTNTAVGWFSLFSATTGSFNTGVGAGALALNTGDTSSKRFKEDIKSMGDASQALFSLKPVTFCY